MMKIPYSIDTLMDAQAIEARDRQDRRVHLAIIDLTKTRRHVTPQIDNLEI